MFVGRESIVNLKMQPSLTILFIMRIDASMNRCKLRLIIPSWECLIQICQPIVLAIESRGVHLILVICSLYYMYHPPQGRDVS